MPKASKDFLEAMWSVPDSAEATLMKLSQVSCDQRCYDLAMNFLRDHAMANPDYGRKLGAEIQGLIESWIESEQDKLAGYDPRNDSLDHDYSMNG